MTLGDLDVHVPAPEVPPLGARGVYFSAQAGGVYPARELQSRDYLPDMPGGLRSGCDRFAEGILWNFTRGVGSALDVGHDGPIRWQCSEA